MIELKVPGKLFLMGEYAAMSPGATSVIAAINRMMVFNIAAAPTMAIISDFGTLDANDMFSNKESMRYVSAALGVVHDFVGCDNPYSLKITSQLDSSSGQKYGFGSSGVVIVGVIKAILAFYNRPVPSMLVFKLAVMAQRRMGEFSSGGDLAAAVWGGVVSYTRYDVAWLVAQESEMDLLSQDWPLLSVSSLSYDWYYVGVGWTQCVNRTQPYVMVFEKWKHDYPQKASDFMARAQIAVNDFITASIERNIVSLFFAIKQYRELMVMLQSEVEIDIEIPRLTHLISDAKAHGFVAKISGSGGGDCGIIFGKSKNSENLKKLSQEWLKHGILMLDVEVF